MGRLIWSPSALEDADAIAAFIVQHFSLRGYSKQWIESRPIRNPVESSLS